MGQFFTDFDGTMLDLWDFSASTASEINIHDAETICMNPGQFIVANADLFQFHLPFMMKLGIRRGIVDGVYDQIAHFISFGGIGYNELPTDNVLQIVWDGMNGARLIYSETEIFITGYGVDSYCDWNKEEEGDYEDAGIVNITEWNRMTFEPTMSPITSSSPTQGPVEVPTTDPTMQPSACLCPAVVNPFCCNDQNFGNECIANCNGFDTSDCEAGECIVNISKAHANDAMYFLFPFILMTVYL